MYMNIEYNIITIINIIINHDVFVCFVEKIKLKFLAKKCNFIQSEI